ncbi:DUF3291 domain-containing protein [Amycolatopsis rubida]|uniref:DUF3291 domain-containing protein n=1 Tax=Amycolatopsis rubida TaxID=112413 RepID=A0A1I5RZJ4_9PSEU|nr:MULTISPECIES: DUF3291 domain-containing protein [Amycolatopsis]MYW89318.1 DUF3291 domain-containing protein [Amycolatopsis rubida]MYW95087.1 DUF3291 domain-containing protein [Amycolatopsis rubida]MYW96059.1 DUF3291 domain-containing protein [Amycolatopsis rubida]NEC54296.1 DUF3291 domain-containing protein [Amycolatopsis rubida]NEC60074.1 DUF3291 domain-containing protein [Amycolatopsis rubida]
MTEHHLAQLNVGITRYPLDDPRMHGFTSMLDTLNEVADNAPGFVWRLIGDGGNDATEIRTPLGDDVIVNMSVWESRDALWDYVYRSGHLDMLRRRSDWFELPKATFQVLWWIPAGHIPTVEEAVERLELLREKGSSPSAFGFRDSYLPEGAASAP